MVNSVVKQKTTVLLGAIMVKYAKRNGKRQKTLCLVLSIIKIGVGLLYKMGDKLT